MIQKYGITLNILPARVASVTTYKIRTELIPAKTTLQTKEVNYPFTINALPIRLNLSQAIRNTSYKFLSDILQVYIDEDRELKTLLNFGNDKQNVVLARRLGEILSNGDRTLQLKLLRPLPDDVGLETPAFISREVANTLIDKFRVRFAAPIDATPYLRPKNTGIKINNELGKSLKNVTLQLLSLETGSVGTGDSSFNRTFEDEIYRRWYSYDFNSAELNLEFDDYSKFVFYGSAAMRVASFAEKIRQIEILDDRRKQFAGDVFTGELASAGAKFILDQSTKLAKEKEDIIRSFDRYEQYLYFTPSGSISPYSASFDYVDTGIEYNEIGYWPKSGSVLWPVNSEVAQLWLGTQSEIAQRYDEFNENNLINTIPTHIREDEENAPYFTFIAMVGHFFDIIKPYVDQFPLIYSRYTNPNEELSKDLVAEIAEAVGFTMPTLNSLYELNTAILGDENTPPLRDYSAEAHKRLLHNLAFFAKSKGTKTALTMALRTLGISQQLIDVGESGISSTGSFYVFEEFTNGIDFRNTTDGTIALPISSSLRVPPPRSITLDIKLPEAINSTLLTGDDNWALNVVVHPTNPSLGRFEIVSGSNSELLLSSSYYEIFDNQPLFVAINTVPSIISSNASLRVIQTFDDNILYNSVNTEQGTSPDTVRLLNLWVQTDNIYIGGSGSISTGTFRGIVDEIRLWGLNLTTENIINAAFNPNTSAGNLYTQASELLYAQLSFNKIDGSLLPGQIINESPYRFASTAPSLETFQVTGIDEESFTRYSRTVREYLPQVGSLGYVTQKIKILPPAEFGPENTTGEGVKRLSRFKSVVSNRKSRSRRSGNKVILGSSPTRVVNQNIVRTFGGNNINSAYGLPSKYPQLENTLEKLRDYYNRYYYVDVNPNTFIRIIAPLHGMLDQFVEYFIPSKASLINGIIIEPNVLEKIDIPFLRKFRFYGANTRKTLNAAKSLTSGAADYGATFNVSQAIDTFELRNTSASYDTFNSTIDALQEQFTAKYIYNTASVDMVPYTSGNVPTYMARVEADEWVLSSSISNLTTTIKADTETLVGDYKLIDLQHVDWLSYQQISRSYSNDLSELELTPNGYPIKQLPYPKLAIDMGYGTLNKVGYDDRNFGRDGAEPYNRIYPRKLFAYEINQIRDAGITSLNPVGLYEIKPAGDFDEIGAITYFNNPQGIYFFPEIKYNPVYSQPLNAVWDFDEQIFIEGATTWQAGQRYKVNDVVLQDVDADENLGQDFAENARNGNGKYYVFKTRPSYSDPGDGTTFYLDDVPSYVPPSLDGTNWSRLRFRPKRVLQPYRIIFDTFTIPEPRLNNFKTTTIDINTIVDEYTRYVDEIRLDLLSANGIAQGEISLQNIAALLAIQSNNNNIRLRLYRTLEDRAADLNRDIQTAPTGSHGVLLDTEITQTNIVQLINPIVTLVSEGLPPNGTLYYTVNNTSVQSKVATRILLYYFTIEVQRKIPVGYLRKHYRFFRDNSTALKRRTYEGCKFRITSISSDGSPIYDTIDGLPPVQVFIGEGTEVRVAATTQNNEIITGGGGTLRSQ
jgi:hypothetical protein